MRNGLNASRIALIVASGLMLPVLCLQAAEPPPGLLRKIAKRETQVAAEMNNFTYQQIMTVQEISQSNDSGGVYREIREVTFSPSRERYEKVVGSVTNTLTHIRLTELDFRDLRDIQPFLLTADKLFLYEGEYKGEQTVEGVKCFVESVRPRQVLSGQRYFEGLVWVREDDFTVIQTEGQAVPQIETLKEQNLTPRFKTIRRVVDGRWFFPAETVADDTLYFRSQPQRIRFEVRYSKYQRFNANSTIAYP